MPTNEGLLFCCCCWMDRWINDVSLCDLKISFQLARWIFRSRAVASRASLIVSLVAAALLLSPRKHGMAFSPAKRSSYFYSVSVCQSSFGVKEARKQQLVPTIILWQLKTCSFISHRLTSSKSFTTRDFMEIAQITLKSLPDFVSSLLITTLVSCMYSYSCRFIKIISAHTYSNVKYSYFCSIYIIRLLYFLIHALNRIVFSRHY